MRIAILGGGFTGLTAAYYLQKNKHQVTVFEKEKLLGGLASGFKMDTWEWTLEKAYHHIFSIDDDILSFSRETGFDSFMFTEPETASIYGGQNNYRIIPVDTPQDFLRFPLLPMFDKLRSAAVLAFLKVSPFMPVYEKYTAKAFLIRTMGERTWSVLWQELFRKKFGKYAENILASFIWARINKRTKKLGYVRGGFQVFIDHIAQKAEAMGVAIEKGTEVSRIEKKGGQFVVGGSIYDAVISTLPTPVLIRIASDIFPLEYVSQLSKLRYLYAVNLILETSEPILENTYWLNSSEKTLPFMVLVQQTNFVDKKHYGGKHIAYVAKYVDREDRLMKMNEDEIIGLFLPYLEKIAAKKILIHRSLLFKAPFSQPIFDQIFLDNKPSFKTPVDNFFVANLDMTYPYDRGTNYAVKLGKDISTIIG